MKTKQKWAFGPIISRMHLYNRISDVSIILEYFLTYVYDLIVSNIWKLSWHISSKSHIDHKIIDFENQIRMAK